MGLIVFVAPFPDLPANNMAPSREETKEDPARTLLWINTRINDIYSIGQPRGAALGALFSFAATMETRNTVYDYCKTANGAIADGGQYDRNQTIVQGLLKQAIKGFCQDSLAIITEQNSPASDLAATPTTLLQTYLEQWRALHSVCEHVSKYLFPTASQFDYRGIHLAIWRKEVLNAKTLKPPRYESAVTVLPLQGNSFTKVVSAMAALYREKVEKQGDLNQEVSDADETAAIDIKQEDIKQEEVEQSEPHLIVGPEDLKQEDLKQDDSKQSKKGEDVLEACIDTLKELGLKLFDGEVQDNMPENLLSTYLPVPVNPDTTGLHYTG